MWAATVCTCDLDIFNFCSDAAAIVFKTLEDQIKRTLENFTESGMDFFALQLYVSVTFSSIDHIRILTVGLELACKRG